jgi:hypothetical protein
MPNNRTSRPGLFGGVPWPLALRSFPNVLNVGKIAQPARRELRCNQIVLGNKKPRESALRVDNPFNAPFPCSIEINPVDPRQDIDRGRLPSEPNELTRVGEVVHPYICEQSAEATSAA